MLGTRNEKQPPLFIYNFRMEDQIPEDHPLRLIKERIDFGFIREWVRPLYGYNGHKSEDPVVILKLMFLLFFYNLPSERELLRQVRYRLDFLWFLGLQLGEAIPHPSVLSKARRRWGVTIFEGAFLQVVWACVRSGLVGGGKIHLDGSLVRANAARDSVVEVAPELVAQLKAVYAEQAGKLGEPAEEAAEAAVRGPVAVEEEPVEPKKYYAKQNARLVSRTDPEAAVVKQSRGDQAVPRYKHHRVVDDAYGVITAVATTPGDVEENRLLAPLVRQHEANTGQEVETVVADRQYGTTENLGWCGRRGIRAHLGEMPQRRDEAIFAVEEFRWDAERDCYWCPAGQALVRQAARKPGRYVYYRGNREVCAACPLREQCTRSRNGVRRLRRHVWQEEVDRAREQSRSREAKRDRKRRRHLMEGSFADAANNHHFKRARWRGLEQQQIQDLLIAMCQNMRLLLRYGWRQAGAGAAALPAGGPAPFFASFEGFFWSFCVLLAVSRRASVVR